MGAKDGSVFSVFNFFRPKTQLASVGFLLFLALRSVSFWPLPPGAPLALRRVEPRFKDDSVTVASASLQRRLRTHPRCATTISRLVTNSDSVKYWYGTSMTQHGRTFIYIDLTPVAKLATSVSPLFDLFCASLTIFTSLLKFCKAKSRFMAALRRVNRSGLRFHKTLVLS